ncbi:uncharacterized protein LOC109708106 [Ananas comosus]|uniref:Uncharacterized protein LOC109708106 n=1 Tax=Ananas comosus TaxID=4615 RepID=A0A6P5EP72_ANACO|nr:uncharacterized protein LOC109708106 [Ananas comosus]XP_020085294.1 uncharacterized protein LOC109708106 [Ananas comosus]
MGNCAFRGFEEGGDSSSTIKVVTASGGIVELRQPVAVESVTNGFPGHGVYRIRSFSSPQQLLHNEELIAGERYYLRPINHPHHTLPSHAAPYRVSFDRDGSFWKKQEIAQSAVPYNRFHGYVGNSCNSGGGMWKVKLVISPQQLNEILSQEARTEALIESVRAVGQWGFLSGELRPVEPRE